MITGSCLCGDVRWHLEAPFTRATHCHCSMCRKAHGAPFATYAEARVEDFHLDAGADAIVSYESSPGFIRRFCGHCGSVVPELDGERQISIPLGGVDGDPGVRVEAHIFAASVAPWWTIDDDLPRHDVWPEGESGPVISQPSPEPPAGGVLHGSCLCGDVAYEVRAPLKRVVNCHCGRCRKARAAAMTTNGFTAQDDVVFVRGGDSVKTFKPEGARFFTQAFCPRCGSPVPRLDPARGIAVIPLGSLDDDPGRGVDCHIFVDSKATWYEIGGDLPRHGAAPPPA